MISGENVYFKRFTRTVNDKGILIPITSNPYKYIKDNVDYYTSLYDYNTKHYNQFKEKGTISGIEDVTTTRLLFDFDANKEKQTTVSDARNDAISLIERLKSYGVGDDIAIWFTGNKGYHIELETTSVFNPQEFRNVVFALAKDLKSFDTEINNASRIIRLPLTKHEKSGLYKVPLTFDELCNASEEEIKAIALEKYEPDSLPSYNIVKLPESILRFKEVAKKEPLKEVFTIKELDLSKKPTWLTDCKFALSQGLFKDGIKHHSFMSLAATYKNQGLPEDVVLGMIKGVAELQAKRNNSEVVLEKNLKRIVDEVFDAAWEDGSYSCKNPGWLQDYCQSHNFRCLHEKKYELVEIGKVSSNFKEYAKNINKNTIKTGIPELDKKIRITTSMVVGILGSPGSGKSTFALNILNEISKNNEKAAMYSMDMGEPLIYQKLVQKYSGFNSDKIFDMYSTNEENIEKLLNDGFIDLEEAEEKIKNIPLNIKLMEEFEQKVSDEYKNVKFSFKSGITVEDIKNDVIKYEESTNEKLRLIVIDYLECLNGPFSDSNANTSIIVQKLKDLANEQKLCVVLLLQPNKFAGDPSDAITSYRQIKGASAIEQSCRIIIGLWRDGFNPEHPENDRFITLSVLKNNMGTLTQVDCAWNGERGEIKEIGFSEKENLKEIRENKAAKKAKENEF